MNLERYKPFPPWLIAKVSGETPYMEYAFLLFAIWIPFV